MSIQTNETTGLTTIHVAKGLLRAMVLRGALESAGIPVMLSYESAGPAIGIMLGKIGEVRVMVPIEWATEARELLAAEPRTGEIFSVPPDVVGKTS